MPRRGQRSEIFFPKLRNFPPARLLSPEPANELLRRLPARRQAESSRRSPPSSHLRAVKVCNAATSAVMCGLDLCCRRHWLEHQFWALWPSPCYYPTSPPENAL